MDCFGRFRLHCFFFIRLLYAVLLMSLDSSSFLLRQAFADNEAVTRSLQVDLSLPWLYPSLLEYPCPVLLCLSLLLSWGVQCVHCMMHECITIKVGGNEKTKNT